MAELFIELQGEEIPALLQEAAEQQLAEALRHGLIDNVLTDDDVIPLAWSGPRRLAVWVEYVAEIQPDLDDEKRGPRTDAPQEAIEGFLNSAGVRKDRVVNRDTPKGEFMFAEIKRKGLKAEDILPDMISGILTGFKWPRAMRWQHSRQSWVRPLHRILVIFGGKVLKGAYDLGGGMEIVFGNETVGHSILAPEPFTISGSKDYEAKLKKGFVIADRAVRKKRIEVRLKGLATQNKLKLREDPGLLGEVVGLVETPNAILGKIDPAFMDLPEEILVSAMRNHQKYFAFTDSEGGLAPVFATIANMTPDKKRDATIREGNERVLRARLADAKFFWDRDREEGLDAMASRLDSIQFFDRLGTMADKAKRISTLSSYISESVNDDTLDRAVYSLHSEKVGLLVKADLVSQTVGELPELQGVIGSYLVDKDYSRAIAEHYRPLGPDDAIPSGKLGQIVALADKLDTLVGFFGIDLAPTGSKDPHALRRAALGVIRIVIESGMVLRLGPIFGEAARLYDFKSPPEALPGFIHDRLKVWMRDRGARHDIVAAVIRPDDKRADDILHLYRLVGALTELLESDDGKGLLAGYTRAISILVAEEKKDNQRHDGEVDKSLLKTAEEKSLFKAVGMLVEKPVKSTDDAINRMKSLGELRAPIDAFFNAVTVNDEDRKIRANRLNLLGQVRAEMEEVADFSLIEG